MEKIFYKSILTPNEFEIPKIKWSRFIGNVFHIKDKNDAEKKINEISNKYHDATHNCYAYTYGTNINFDLFGQLNITPDYFKSSDDWEPSNTAWKPILSQIQWQDLHNILIIVTRYFWGTLLGVGWLIQAYSECAKQTILNSQIVQVEMTQQKKIEFDYSYIATVMNLLNRYNAKIINESHGWNANIIFEINKWYIDSFSKEIFNQSKWSITVKDT